MTNIGERGSTASGLPSLCGLDLCSVAAIVVDGNLNALPINRYACELLAPGSGLSLQHGKLVLEVNASRRLLQAALHSILAGPSDAVEALGIERRGSAHPLCCLLMRHPDDHPLPSSETPLSSPVALLLITDPDRLTSAEPGHLATWFGLTRREAQITALIGQGRTLDEAATELDISRGTANTHLKHVFMKVGVNTQVQLVALVRSVAFGRTATRPNKPDPE